jgi:hypothetical protein
MERDMSYPRDLDEIPTAELEQELETRRQLQMQGRCDYCGRLPTEPPCKFPQRHNAPKKWAHHGISTATIELRKFDNGQR